MSSASAVFRLIKSSNLVRVPSASGALWRVEPRVRRVTTRRTRSSDTCSAEPSIGIGSCVRQAVEVRLRHDLAEDVRGPDLPIDH